MNCNSRIIFGLGCFFSFALSAMQTHEQMHASTIVKGSNTDLAMRFIYQRMGLDDAASENILNRSHLVNTLVTSYEKQIEELSCLTSSNTANTEQIQQSRGLVKRMHDYFAKAFEEVDRVVWRRKDDGYGYYTPSEIDQILLFEGVRQKWQDEVDARVKILLHDSQAQEQDAKRVLSLESLIKYDTSSVVSRRVKIR